MPALPEELDRPGCKSQITELLKNLCFTSQSVSRITIKLVSCHVGTRLFDHHLISRNPVGCEIDATLVGVTDRMSHEVTAAEGNGARRMRLRCRRLRYGEGIDDPLCHS